MTYKIIHRDFEIDLLDKNVDYTEQNQWFVNGAPINFTLPVSMTLTRELDEVFNMLSHLNSNVRQTTFDVKIYKMNKFYDAIMSIESIRDLDLEISFKYGFEEYPNFSKALREIPMEEKEVTGLRLDANAVKPLSYPDTNYKYPAVFIPIDIIQDNSTRFDSFEGIINLFEAGAYVENTVDQVDNIAINRSIIQPFPYLIYVLKQGFADAGYTLAGDILEDEKIQKVLFGQVSDYYITFSPTQQEWVLKTTDLLPFTDNSGNDSTVPGEFIEDPNTSNLPELIRTIIHNEVINQSWPVFIFAQGWFYETLTVTDTGSYKLAGNLVEKKRKFAISFLYIYIDDELVYESLHSDSLQEERSFFESVEFDFVVTSSSTIKVYTMNAIDYNQEQTEILESNIVDLTLTKIADLVNGELVPALNEANKVKLNETMPNKNFGELVKAVMAWRNLDIRPDFTTKEVSMNRIDTAISLPVTQDLRDTEVRHPLREPNQKKSFLLKFDSAQDNPDYKQLLYSRNGEQIERIQIDENTEEINIGLLPMFNKAVGVLNTANFEDKNDNILPVFYHDDATTQDNATLDPTSLMVPTVFEQDYKTWLSFRLYSQTFKWSNILTIEDALVLSTYNRSFAYNQNHLLRQLVVRLIDKDFAEVDFESEA